MNMVVDEKYIKDAVFDLVRLHGSYTKTAEIIRCSTGHLSSVLSGRKQPSKRMLAVLGIEKAVVYKLKEKV